MIFGRLAATAPTRSDEETSDREHCKSKKEQENFAFQGGDWRRVAADEVATHYRGVGALTY
jgi:hypothetical protein